MSIKYILKNKPNKSGKYPIALKVSRNGKVKLIFMKMYCEKNQWNADTQEFRKNFPDYKVYNQVLLKKKQEALAIIQNFELEDKQWEIDDFVKEFRNEAKTKSITVIELFDEYIAELKNMEKLSTAKTYITTRNSLVKFKGKKIQFKDITPDFLNRYESFLRTNNNKNGGIAFKMRILRAVYNLAIFRELISNANYPFDKWKISKIKIEPNKRALSWEELQKFKSIPIEDHPDLLEAYYYFVFSVFTRGMNFQDMMLLEWRDIKNDQIRYVRSKTKQPLTLQIIPAAQEILDYYKAQNRDSKYVFPILLQDDLTPQQIYNRKHKVLRRYNFHLKKLGKLAGIDENLTSYVARHTFATILKMKGTSIEKLSEMLGHSSPLVTQAYLKPFGNEDLDKENQIFNEL